MLAEQDGKLLNLLQREFPLVAEPFRAVAERLGRQEPAVLERVQQLKDEGIIRQISAIFDSRALGYKSSLVAMKVPQERVDQAAEAINAHPGVSHNYLRNHDVNLWFTITVHPSVDLHSEVERLAEAAQADGVWLLPAIRVFKIGVSFDMAGEGDAVQRETPPSGSGASGTVPLSDVEILAVRALQEDLPVVSRPFAEMASAFGVGEDELLSLGRGLLEKGVMRRFAAVIRHRKAGYTANAMVVWKVPEGRIEEVGAVLASFSVVSHCYQRPTYPEWPYSVFTMIHARREEECYRAAQEMSQACGISEYELLFSTKEYKKVRVRYFEEGLERTRRAGWNPSGANRGGL